MAFADDLIIPFTGNNIDIPVGLKRETELDGMFIFGCRAEAVSGGQSGGNATHLHLRLGEHTHIFYTFDVNIVQANQSSGLKQVSSLGHGHGNTTSNGAAVDTVAVSNNPLHYETIFCKTSNLDLIPAGCLIFSGNKDVPDGTEVANGAGEFPLDLSGRLLKGAPTGGNAGLLGGVLEHRHIMNHVHAAKLSGNSTPTQGATAPIGSGLSDIHQHSAGTNDLDIKYTGYAYSMPDYRELLTLYVKTPIEAFTGLRLFFIGAKVDIPVNWSEVIDYREKFICCFVDYLSDPENGGGDIHNHTGDHTHTGIQLSTTGRGLRSNPAGPAAFNAQVHTHIWVFASASATFQNSSAGALYPQYKTVFVIEYTKPYNPQERIYIPMNDRFKKKMGMFSSK